MNKSNNSNNNGTFILLPTVQLHLQQNPTTIALIRNKYTTSLAKRLMGSSQTPGITQQNLQLTSLPHSPD